MADDAITWDMGDPEPADLLAVVDYTADAGARTVDYDALWHRTVNGEWKGYKNGDEYYLDWPELVRRWGPVCPAPPTI